MNTCRKYFTWNLVFVLIVLMSTLGCAAALTAEVVPTADCQNEAVRATNMPETTLRVAPAAIAPSSQLGLDQIPYIPGLASQRVLDPSGQIVTANYRNVDGISIASFDPKDKYHNSQVSWNWDRLSQSEKNQALNWIFDPQQMVYYHFDDHEEWVGNALKWIPKLAAISSPTDSDIAAHWQDDGPTLNASTLYEALSRVKSLSLVRERRTCSYGFSELGLIEYGGEIILFTSPAWGKVSVETREILTAVWTIKEAMVIYYPQSLGWASSCPSESARLKNEYYSTIWLLQAQRALSRFVPEDNGYWQDQEIPFQLKKIATQSFPPCLPPASFH